jgi:hypothetical protein
MLLCSAELAVLDRVDLVAAGEVRAVDLGRRHGGQPLGDPDPGCQLRRPGNRA